MLLKRNIARNLWTLHLMKRSRRISPDLRPDNNIAPAQSVTIVRLNSTDWHREFVMFKRPANSVVQKR